MDHDDPISIELRVRPNIGVLDGLDPSNVAQQRIASVLGPWVDALDARIVEPRMSHDRRESLEGRARLWVRWATTPATANGMGGGGIAPTAEALAAQPIEELRDAALSFWGWLKRDVPDGHPLLRAGASTAGDRARSTAYRPGTLTTFLGGLRLWAENNGIDPDDFVAAVELAGRRSPKAPPERKRITLTADELMTMLEVLDADAVECHLTGVRRRAWHARQKAALLVQVLGVLRISEVGRLYRDQSSVRELDRALVVRLDWTKPGWGRDVVLAASGGPFCPIGALRAWLVVAAECGYGDLDGLWLPQVLIRPKPGLRAVAAPSYDRELMYFEMVARAAGVLTPDIERDTQIVLGTHSNRRLMPSLAAQAGKDLAFIATMAGGPWAAGSPIPGAYAQMGVAFAVTTAVLEAEDA